MIAQRSLLAVMFAAATAQAAPSVSWSIDETITRSDQSIQWVSPTAIDLGFDQYLYDYEITRVEASVRVLFEITQDVTDLIGASFDLVGSGEFANLPGVLIDDAIDDPTTGTAANIRIEIDANGFGRADFTDISLGSVDTGLFGVRDIESVRLEATVEVSGFEFQPGDFNGDGAVDRNDWRTWRQNYGAAGPTPADANDDGLIDAADYTVWRDRFESPLDAAGTPEPSAGALACFMSASLALRRG